MKNLVETIKQYQQDENLSDGQFTKLLGVDRSTWAYIKSGKRKPGLKFLKAIGQIPELAPLIHVEICNITDAHQTHQNKILGARRKILKYNPHVFCGGMALILIGDWVDLFVLVVLGAVVLSWPICFMLWTYPRD